MNRERLSLFEKYECSGYWFLPGNESQRVPGIVHYDPPEGIKLTLWGRLPSSENNRVYPRFPIVLGITVNRTPVTIIDAYCTSPGTADEINEMKFDVQFILIGVHATEGKSTLFEQLATSYTNFEDWTCVQPMDFGVDKTGNGDSVWLALESTLVV